MQGERTCPTCGRRYCGSFGGMCPVERATIDVAEVFAQFGPAIRSAVGTGRTPETHTDPEAG